MTYLTTVLQAFFTDYVHAQRNLSANTVASYRDAWRLLIKHICATTATPADHIRLEDIDRSVVTGFLEHLATERENSAATRNGRLTAICAVFTHALPDHPEHAESLRQILAIPPAKTSKPQIGYLNEAESAALLAAPNLGSWVGRRDQAMLALVIHTGLRVSELITLTIPSIHVGTSPHVECEGKGRKHRAIPISTPLAEQMHRYLTERANRTGEALFPGPHGRALSRDAIERRLAIHLGTASTSCPSLRGKHITMHSLRHTTAMNLLHAGVDVSLIALWLGHEQTSTTDMYLQADMETKKNILDKTRHPEIEAGTYTPSPDVLTWLENL
ncbi:MULTISPECIES: tyrosine-type recombinase/integrase [Micrococcaceae]|uniref:Tyrosine-type recombinase/integrase n=3 Tax=Micrococcaceae TaxID=1268 RepID=A0A7X8TLW2_9MICC|nr:MULTISPECIES: tyrosine-type recombinase/integrase [Micrococcaceae]MBB3667763.1 site-specific recombinase XerD [Garicola koreensis]NLS11172.1 tyrosine-type recombinase/integrase [Nesterenkonia sedimenti]GGE79275.1 integrase [Nesterenkonia cremea]